VRSTIDIEIAAPPELVYALASDVTAWERLLPHYSRSRAERRHGDGSTTCRFVARRPIIGLLGLGLPVAWRSRVTADPAARRLRFRHIGGVTAGMDVTWYVEPGGGGSTRVQIEHVFERGPADLLPRVVEHVFTRPIAGRTLATFKSLAEALLAVGSQAP
jgi:ribosome-associated toxin RatA of RatAB toxin-antitoxin module